MKKPICALTLIELITALALFSMVILAATSLQLFGRNQLVTAQQKAKLQNEVMQLIGHMKRQGMHATGTIANGFSFTAINGYPCLEFYIDANGNGIRDASPPDRWVAYLYRPDLFEVWYYPNAGFSNPILFIDPYEIIATGITNVGWANPAGTNVVTLTSVSARKYPAQACSDRNPCAVMNSVISMPSVSSN